MKIDIYLKNKEYYDDAQLLARSFFSRADVTHFSEFTDGASSLEEGKLYLFLEDMTPDQEEERSLNRSQLHDLFKKRVYKHLVSLTGRNLPWGFLTGVRPSKRAMALLDEGMEDAAVIKTFIDSYMVSEEKGDLALKVAKNEKRILEYAGVRNGYSLYLGIPFCPTTCLYCSFTSYPVETARKQGKISKYLEALKTEIKEIGRIIGIAGKNDERFSGSPTSVYFGGGTPTSLNVSELDMILSELRSAFDLSETVEFTVEAGRPDSISMEKLKVLKKQGVNRMSINPQTMNEDTLELIGRHHTVREVEEAFAMARECGFDNINMDIIMGLPGEGEAHIKKTLEEVRALGPDCITVHSLSIKRAARLNTEKKKYEDISITNDHMALAVESAKETGMIPYYMYRQQNMAGNQENIGFAKKGKESLYNILIMEEIQPIIALGAGAASKFIYDNECERSGKRIERAENVKNVDEYIGRIGEMIERKREKFDRVKGD